jgi:surface protein
MFKRATSFDQPLDAWDVSNVTDMKGMFKDAESFSHYPKSWVVPAEGSKDMFKGTKVEAEAKNSPLKTR